MPFRPYRLWAPLAALCFAASALAIEPFTISEIRAEGLQRLDIGTVLSYLPLAPGDQLNDQTSRQAIRALYASGLFQDVELERAVYVTNDERDAIKKRVNTRLGSTIVEEKSYQSY